MLNFFTLLHLYRTKNNKLLKNNKKFYKFWLLVLFVGMFSYNNLYAQDTIPQIKVSTDKVFIDGKLYYIHIVEKGQTLYSISRAYGVEESDVAAENISVMYGPLQIGQALKVPVYQKRSDKDDNKRSKKSKDYIQHKVKPKETLTFLSRKYRVLIDTIVKYNPSTANGLIQIDQIIIIPKQAVNSIDKSNKPAQQDVVVHHVEAGETLSALQRKYHVSIDRIVMANPELVDGLKAGMDVKIPLSSEATELMAQDSVDFYSAMQDSMQLSIDSLGREPVVFACGEQDWDRFKSFKIALLLPFQVNNPLPDSLISSNAISKYITNDKDNTYYFEFYEGFLMALDSLKSLGMKIELSVFDTQKSLYKTQKIIEQLRNNRPDLIVGPVFKEMIQEVAEFARVNEIPIVSPLLTEPETLNKNPYFFQVTPDFTTSIDKFSGYIANADKSYKNIVFINSGDSLYIHEILYFKDKLYSELESDFNHSLSSFKEIVIRKEELNKTNHLFTIKPRLEQSFAKDSQNYIILPSRNMPYVSSMMDILNQMTNYNIKVFGYSELQRFNRIEQEYFHNLNTEVFSPFYFDMKDEKTLRFLTKYQERFNNIPVRFTTLGYNFTLLGYDIGFYFGNALRIFGNQFPGCLSYYDPELLLSKYKFERKDVYSGFTNTTLQVIKFEEDFKVSNSVIE